jgi:hypothetical protein
LALLGGVEVEGDEAVTVAVGAAAGDPAATSA